MQNRSKLLLAGLTAALAFGAFVSASSANRLGLSSRQWRASWNTMKFIDGFGTIECHVTLEGSFHSRTISKVLEALFGYVSRATVDEAKCTGGFAGALTETLPWHVRYGGFEGTLPAITIVFLRLVGAKYIVQIGTSQCLYTSTAASPMKTIWRVQGGVFESVELNEQAAIPFTTGSGQLLCGNGRVAGHSNQPSEGPGGSRIGISLVA